MHDPVSEYTCGHSSHGNDCRCDVDLELLKHPLPPKRHTMQQWWDEYEELYCPSIARMRSPAVMEATVLWMDQLGLAQDRRNVDRGKPVRALLSRGYEPAEIAEAFGATLADVLATVTTADAETAVEAIEQLRAGRSRYAVALATGMSEPAVGRLATAIGMAKGTKAGSGQASSAKYSAQQVQQVLRLREQGRSWGQIAKIMGLPNAATATGIARRSARVLGSIG